MGGGWALLFTSDREVLINPKIISVSPSTKQARYCLLPRRLSAEKSMGAQGRKGTQKREKGKIFLPVVPHTSRSSPVAHPSRSSCKTSEEEAEQDILISNKILRKC